MAKPSLYLYDLCPFCTRVRMILGAHKIKHELVFLAYDDFDTPTRLCGKKMVPILQLNAESPPRLLTESLDIVKFIDEDPEKLFGGHKPLLAPAGEAAEIERVMDEVYQDTRRLLYPRLHKSCNLPEFQTKASRDCWAERKSFDDMTFEQCLQTSNAYVTRINTALEKLDSLVASPSHISKSGFSYDDIILFSKLRNWTMAKDLKFPPNVLAYLRTMSEYTDVPLYFALAC
eukprot:GHVU01037153.1.p1 GENE.GHVU01037153.1~~GHVU01037153.1.p1  ORF type:complete len:231 (-),score=33.97 GHVU01037153.1:206-898(-)